MTRSISEKDRFSGCLIGQCLGDALGFPVEGAAPATCERYVREHLTGDLDGGGDETAPGPSVDRSELAIGQYTDDSQLARELVQSCVACGGFDPEDYAKRIAAIFAEDRVVGRGIATDEAARRLAAGVPWREAGAPPPSAGNGSAMRAAPIGLLCFDRPDELVRLAHEQSRITHADPRCSAGAVAIAGCVALAFRERAASDTWLTRVAAWAARIDEGFGRHLHELRAWVALPPDEAVSPIARCGVEPRYEDGWPGISPFVVSSVLWSLYAFFKSPDDYMRTIQTAIAVGGDVDTTAAMAGAISGAYLGLAGIPRAIARGVTDQGTWGYEELVDLAHRFHALRAAG